jgi:hypothetical protein
MSTKNEVINRLIEAKTEAEIFLERCEMAIKSVNASESYYRDRDFSAAKRASLDLSRSLAKLRSSLYR